MKYRALVFLLSFFIAIIGFSQHSNTVISINDSINISFDEFEYIFKKNNKNNNFTKEEVEEYLKLFIDFKLKVIEAKKLGLEKDSKFINELNGYKKQLATPYLTDTVKLNQLINESLEWLKYDVRASHILVKLPKNSLAEDTLIAYNKIWGIYKELLSGSDFNNLAKTKSEDNYAKETAGEIGYFTCFSFEYSVEKAVYNLKVGEYSKPVRSSIGYHIFLLTDKRPAIGQMTVAHIYLKGNNDSTKIKSEKIYSLIKEGTESFEDCVIEYSEDKGSIKKGGELPVIKVGKTTIDFENAIIKLNENEISTPIKTDIGYHIVKVLKKSDNSFKENYYAIKQKVLKDKIRSELINNSFRKLLKTEYLVKVNNKKLKSLTKIIDTNIYYGTWNYIPKESYKKTIVYNSKIGELSLDDLLNYIKTNQFTSEKIELNKLINNYSEDFIFQYLLDYKNKHLIDNEQSFARLLNEYSEGILLFNLTDKLIWSQAMSDTAGLRAYFNDNREKYKSENSADIRFYSSSDKETIENAFSLAKVMKSKEKQYFEFLNEFNKKFPGNDLEVSSGNFIKGKNEVADLFDWESGLKEIKQFDDKYYFIDVLNFNPAGLKTLNDARGLVIADYQNYLEKEWVKTLNNINKVVVNNDLLKELYEHNE